MIGHLMGPTEQQPDPRGELDDSLQVAEWTVPGARPVVEVESGAPSWWKGDEDATESFLRAAGARFDDQGRLIRG